MAAASTAQSQSQSQSPSNADSASQSPTPADPTVHHPDDDATTPKGSPAVRFSGVNEEIPPEQLDACENLPPTQLTPSAEAAIRKLSHSLQSADLQAERLTGYAYEPISLPASRVHSREESSSGNASREHTRSSGRPSPRSSTMHSPPLTPAATKSRDGPAASTPPTPLSSEMTGEPPAMTPQISPPHSTPAAGPTSAPRPESSGHASTAPSTESDESRAHRGFSIGPKDGDSVPASRDTSPGRSVSSVYSRPLIPAGDANDPYSAANRPPQSKHIDARFVFSRTPRRTSPSTSSVSLPRSLRGSETEKKNKRDGHSAMYHEDSAATLHSRHGSMAELKRFMKLGGLHHRQKRAKSPSPPSKATAVVPVFGKKAELPFADDHGLAQKYGKFGKVLGSGAGGSVRIIKRSSDGVTFAVKEFRARHSYETEREYAKKVTAEFCIGSTLHHGNIIETLDIVHEKSKWFEVMEYAPFDLFAIVMTGKMSRAEVSCAFLQILSGVTYLHGMGLAHRDLKLDNVVVNEHGVMKIIDFGSASVFKYPFENDIVLASGIVGSDPYLAPEVYEERKYDPQAVDIWSLAIIFCCMSLRRFPWKLPRPTDNSYRLFSSAPSPGTELRGLSGPPIKSSTDLGSATERDMMPIPNEERPAPPTSPEPPANPEEKVPNVIKGPWRLLRLLPRETRFIIGRMLQVSPKKRAKLAEILDDPWVANTSICQQLQGRVISAEGHVHTLEPAQSQPPAKGADRST